MREIIYSRLLDGQLEKLKEFCRLNWGKEHPLIHNKAVFDWYYRVDDHINMVIAYAKETEQDIEILGVCGYIPTNSSSNPDVFLSYILSKKGEKFGISLRLIEYIKKITNARTINCNNIRKNTSGIYHFLGYTVADMKHFYRLNEDISEYTLCLINNYQPKSIMEYDLTCEIVEKASQLRGFQFANFSNNLPYKDEGYVTRRYLEYIFHKYIILHVDNNNHQALIIVRKIEYQNHVMFRVVDFIGDISLIGKSGRILDSLMKQYSAEYIDWYSYNISEAVMQQAGFTLALNGDTNIIPFYLQPPVMEEMDVTVFVSNDKTIMFRADGDQDRPNLG